MIVSMTRFSKIAAVAALSTLSLAACSSTTATTGGSVAASASGPSLACPAGSITGEGSTAQTNAIQQIIAAYNDACKNKAKIEYNATGSGAGVKNFNAGLVDFGGSDSALATTEQATALTRCKNNAAWDLPLVVGPVAFSYNLKGVSKLVLNGDVLAKIFMGQITTWNDPAIVALNSGVTLPTTAITVFYRSDDSGTTDNVSKYLKATAPTVWTPDHSKTWKGKGGEGKTGSAGVAQAVTATDGALGYLEWGFATDNKLGIAQLDTGNGGVELNADSVGKALEAAKITGTGAGGQSTKGRIMADDPGATVAATTDHEAAAGSPASLPTGRAVSTTQIHFANIKHGGDRSFRAGAIAAAVIVVLLVLFVGIFLAVIATPSLRRNTVNFFTSTQWNVGTGTLQFGIAGLLWTTALTSVVAMLLAVPVAVGTALLVTQYIPGRIGSMIGFIIDLLAAVPSIIFGLWGLKLLGPFLGPFYAWLQHVLGWIPLFSKGVESTGNVLTASIVLAIMVLPIVSAMSRDVFAQTPRDHIEAALALGATKWEMIRTAVIPYGRSGVIAASMLGLGRALGETIAVMIILSQTNTDGINVSLFAGGETFASKIANNAQEFDSPAKTGAYIAAGLILFVVTFAVNAIARVIADRRVR